MGTHLASRRMFLRSVVLAYLYVAKVVVLGFTCKQNAHLPSVNACDDVTTNYRSGLLIIGDPSELTTCTCRVNLLVKDVDTPVQLWLAPRGSATSLVKACNMKLWVYRHQPRHGPTLCPKIQQPLNYPINKENPVTFKFGFSTKRERTKYCLKYNFQDFEDGQVEVICNKGSPPTTTSKTTTTTTVTSTTTERPTTTTERPTIAISKIISTRIPTSTKRSTTTTSPITTTERLITTKEIIQSVTTKHKKLNNNSISVKSTITPISNVTEALLKELNTKVKSSNKVLNQTTPKPEYTTISKPNSTPNGTYINITKPLIFIIKQKSTKKLIKNSEKATMAPSTEQSTVTPKETKRTTKIATTSTRETTAMPRSSTKVIILTKSKTTTKPTTTTKLPTTTKPTVKQTRTLTLKSTTHTSTVTSIGTTKASTKPTIPPVIVTMDKHLETTLKTTTRPATKRNRKKPNVYVHNKANSTVENKSQLAGLVVVTNPQKTDEVGSKTGKSVSANHHKVETSEGVDEKNNRVPKGKVDSTVNKHEPIHERKAFIIGIAVGFTVIVIFICVMAILCCRLKQRRKDEINLTTCVITAENDGQPMLPMSKSLRNGHDHESVNGHSPMTSKDVKTARRDELMALRNERIARSHIKNESHRV